MKLYFFSFLFLFFSYSLAQTTYSTSPDSSYYSVHYKGKAWMNTKNEYRACQYNVVSVIDSFLYVQVNVAGIEVGRVFATPSNVLFINKIEKKYYDGDYTFIKKFTEINVDFYTLQALFNGFPVSIPDEVSLTYQREFFSDSFTFFRTLSCEYNNYEVELEVKKVTFNDVPEVSATIPKNCTQIILENEELKTNN